MIAAGSRHADWAQAAVPAPDIEIILMMQRLLQRQVLCVGASSAV